MSVLIVLIVIIAVLQLMACSEYFCNWYSEIIYPHISGLLGKITGVLKFPLGEVLMYIAAFLVVCSVILGILIIFFRKKKRYIGFVKKYFFTIACIILGTLIIYSTNWVIPFRSSGVVIENGRDSFTLNEITILRNYLVNRLNECSETVPRTSDGIIKIDDDIDEDIVKAIHGISGDYPRFSGYVPPIKEALCSPFLEWMGIGGYTYPYTMEITGNKFNDRFYYPSFYIHEVSHHFGYYQEDDAEFLSYLACNNSDNILLNYSGLWSVYWYVNQDFIETLLTQYDESEFIEIYKSYPKLNPQVSIDKNYFVSESYELYNQEVSKETEEIFASKAEEIGNVGWEAQADLLKERCYDGVVLLLLQYYDGILY